MSGSSEMAFVAPRGLARRRTALALVVAVAAAGLLLGEQARLDTLRGEVERIEARVDQRRQAAERAAREGQRVSAEAHRIERLLDEQSISDGNTGLPVLDWIERAWTPRIALRSLSIDKAGKEARIEGGAADLEHIYRFSNRLRDAHPERRIGLLRHQVRDIAGSRTYTFSLNVTHP
ncbi:MULTISPECIES: hypothetical protein [Burkholderia]|uniref:PilN domain-containing protein n=2 Tax=Burkholderia gladioli TaxID=28095 RepID=A0A2A7SF30_BURGA|nr:MULTISPECIES: hypothetical protein [Burkholderia]ATF87300.1 hypothetical protein CO712_19425 [Burkholderia gladioli pv. gladioli]MBJ9715992.1 hypothetical protein [Burkholderia gladioli]MBU9156437.1 hypothetical protein [Burkholderia gladioli]MBU9166947.1 hypothetical protein [Burkholderia gladioli]MBU9193255.1 hypothetical protein [Burkholderia gladioli]